MPTKEDILEALHDLEEEIKDLEEALNTNTHRHILKTVQHYSATLLEQQACIDDKMNKMEEMVIPKQQHWIASSKPILVK